MIVGSIRGMSEEKKKTHHIITNSSNQTKPRRIQAIRWLTEPSVKQQHITQTDVCVNKIELAHKFPLHSSSMIRCAVQTYKPTYVSVSVFACLCFWTECFLSIYICVDIARHKYAMDIAELAIKRKAKWIPRAHVTYDSHMSPRLYVYVLITLCVSVDVSKAKEKNYELKKSLLIYQIAAHSSMTYTTIPIFIVFVHVVSRITGTTVRWRGNFRRFWKWKLWTAEYFD